MPKNFPRPNDSADYEERIKKTIHNKESAEFAAEFAEGKELEAIKEKNRRREEVIQESRAGQDNGK